MTRIHTQTPHPHQNRNDSRDNNHAEKLRYFPVFLTIFITSVVIALSACSAAKTIDNSYVQETIDDEHIAKVYFIRTMPLKFKGLADSRITVDINGEALLQIDEGVYTMVKLKPAKATITTHSRTMFTNQTRPINVTRSREYRFIAGKTYFIELKRVNEEFRGIYYDPAPLSLEQAKELASKVKARGLAKEEPIEDISYVAQTPAASPLNPALPENLYPGKTYLLKGNPKYTAPKQPEGKNEITFDQAPESETSPPPKTSN